MPQKPVFSRPPILTIPHCFNTNGTIRSTDERITRLYQRAVHWIDRPCLWEGLFRIACLIKSKPADEPVAALIRDRIRVIGNGAFDGTITEQISIARAAFALYEYNTDRNILKRISLWLRYLEVDFDALCIQDHLLFRPADLMELLVKFYQVTGAKAVLRLCSRLRAMSFDWMTTLHTYQQSIPIRPDDKNHYQLNLTDRPETLDYEEKQKLINHA